MRLVLLLAAVGAVSACSTSVRLAPERRELADPCEGVDCGTGAECIDGTCVPVDDRCAGVECDPGWVCVDGECVDEDPCAGVECDPGWVCVRGDCVPRDACTGVTCDPSDVCVDGVCIPRDDPCADVACQWPQICVGGDCIDLQLDADGDGFPAAIDCDDANAEVFPGVERICSTDCGDGRQLCGPAGHWSPCSAPTDCRCRSGDDRIEACGLCGEARRRCGDGGTWDATLPPCENERECMPGLWLEPCEENCGLRRRVCDDECRWGDPGACFRLHACLPSETRSEACGMCGEMVVSCTAACEWDEGGFCEGEGECWPGTADPGPCGLCGTGPWTCSDACTYEPPDDAACIQPANAVCTPDTEQIVSCGCLDADMDGRQRCAEDCTWDPVEGCPDCTCDVAGGTVLCAGESQIVNQFCPDSQVNVEYECREDADGVCSLHSCLSDGQ